jgi:hypothetical protein
MKKYIISKFQNEFIFWKKYKIKYFSFGSLMGGGWNNGGTGGSLTLTLITGGSLIMKQI